MKKETLADLIRRRREELGLTNFDVATRAGLTTYRIEYLMGDPKGFRPEDVAGLARALEVADAEILRAAGLLRGDRCEAAA